MDALADGSGVLNARGHRSGDDRPAVGALHPLRVVLNARGHRSGDDFPDGAYASAPWVCSTPEGIEAATTLGRHRRHERRRRVLNARGHRSGDDFASDRPVSCAEWCSTPEGIEAATTIATAAALRMPRL